MLLLKTFGGLAVDVDGTPGTGAAQQRKTLALLALLAVAGRRGLSRDKLSAYLWPESDTEHARNLLKQACYALRRDLHVPELFLGAVELRLNPEVIASDIGTLEEALECGDAARAVAVYTGAFLDGFYLPGAAEFERWVEETRAALKARAGEGLVSLATHAASTGDVHAAVKWWRRLAALDPLSARHALGLLRALIAVGERTAALEFGRVHENVVRRELGAAPDPAVGELLRRLREEVKEGATVGTAMEPVSPPATLPMPRVATAQALPRARRIRRRLAIGAGGLVLVGSLVVVRSREPPSIDADLLAVAPFEVLDSQFALLREGLVNVLSRNLDGALRLRTVSPTEVRRRWKGSADRTSARALARRTGAGLVLFGDLAGTGPDSVRLRGAVLDARNDRIVVEIERTAQVDRMDRLADSLVLDVMRGLTPPTSWVSARLVSSGTRSLPALKAFLQGESYLRQFWLDSAVASYTRAIGLDTTFALALRQLGVARGWNYLPAAEESFARAAVFSRGLSPRDSLMVAYSSQSSGLSDPAFYRLVLRQEAILGEMIQRFPEDPELWHEVGEVQFHLGFVWTDSTWNRARRSFDRAIARDSGYAIAYIHPIEIALNDNDPVGALRYVRGFLAIPSVNPEGAGMRLLNLLLDRARVRPRDFDRELETASLAMLRRLAIAIRSWPDAEETQIAVARRLLVKARASLGDTEYELRPYRSLLAHALLRRGHLQEARRTVGNRFVMPAFMELAELGVIPRETVETALVHWVENPDNQGDHVQFPWFLEGACYRTLDAAMWWASRRDTVRLQQLVRREDSAAATLDSARVAPHAHPVPEFARAALALARADTTAALRRFLAYPDSSCPGARQRREVQFRLLAAVGRGPDAAWVWERLYDHRVPLLLERARLADRLGDRPTAVHYYRFVLQSWLHADPELQPFVAETRAALQRLGAEPRR